MVSNSARLTYVSAADCRNLWMEYPAQGKTRGACWVRSDIERSPAELASLFLVRRSRTHLFTIENETPLDPRAFTILAPSSRDTLRLQMFCKRAAR